MPSEPKPQTVAFEVIPHPRFRGDWLLKPAWGHRSGSGTVSGSLPSAMPNG
jgi:hypothetical protein